MTEEEEELPCFSALLDSGSEPGMTEEERELSASDGDHESSSPHAARNATMKMDPIAAMRLQDDSTKNFFIKPRTNRHYKSNTKANSLIPYTA
jgi:hypothetical protein